MFTLMGSTCSHVVMLFLKETCSCPSTTHIPGVKISFGQHSEKDRQTSRSFEKTFVPEVKRGITENVQSQATVMLLLDLMLQPN